jgi:hypothetical protein
MAELEIREYPQSEARALLDDYRAAMDDYRAMAATRPGRALIGFLSGLTKTEIAGRLGVARTTVDSDLAGAEAWPSA